MVIKFLSNRQFPSKRGDNVHFSQLKRDGNNFTTKLGEIVFVRASHLLDQAMFSKAFKKTGNLMRILIVKVRSHVSVLKTTDIELASANGLKKVQILSVEEIETTIRSFSLSSGFRNLFQVFEGGSRIVDGRNKLEIAPVGSPHQIAENRQAIDGLPDRRVFHGRSSIAMFHLPAVLEKSDIVGDSLNAQYKRMLVVHLNGDFAHMMLDPDAFDPGMEIIAHFILIMAGELSAKESGDIIGFDRMDGGADQFFIDGFEVGLAVKDNIGGVFYLHNAPVITSFKMMDDRAIFYRHIIEFFMEPLRLDLIGQGLGFIPVLYRGKGVVDHLETDAVLVELLRQLIMAVVVKLEPEGGPCGDAQVTQPQIGIYEIEIIVQAFGGNRPKISFSRLLVIPRFVRATRLHGRKDMNQARLVAALGYNFFYPLFFAEVLLADEINLQAVFICQTFGIRPDFLAQRLGPFGVIENADAVLIKIAGHSRRIANAGNRAGKNNSVKARQVAANLGGMTVCEKFHGKTFLSNFEEPVLQIKKAA